jgi:hypothetical protein
MVVNRYDPPKTASASVAVTSLVVEAGISPVEPFFLHTTRPLAASTTAPENFVPKRAVVARSVSIAAIRRLGSRWTYPGCHACGGGTRLT